MFYFINLAELFGTFLYHFIKIFFTVSKYYYVLIIYNPYTVSKYIFDQFIEKIGTFFVSFLYQFMIQKKFQICENFEKNLFSHKIFLEKNNFLKHFNKKTGKTVFFSFFSILKSIFEKWTFLLCPFLKNRSKNEKKFVTENLNYFKGLLNML